LAARRILWCLLGLAACQLGVVVPQRSDCVSDLNCPQEAICTLGACVRVARGVVLDLGFTPPNDSGYPKQQVAGVHAVEPDNSIPDQILRPAAVFSGRVLTGAAADQAGIRARVEAQRRGDIAGTLLWASAATVSDPLTGHRLFRLSLVPGTYEVAVFVEDGSVPPFRIASLPIPTSLEKDLYLPPLAAYRRVSGVVIQSATDRTPARGVQVQGFDPDGPTVSTVDRTGQDGRFTVLFPPGDAVYTLRVSRTADGPRVPTVERVGIVANTNLDVGAIELGTYDSPVVFEGVVRCRSGDGPAVAVAGATVQLAGAVGSGTWVEQVTTGATGEFRVEVPPARYEIEIRPPLDSDFAFRKDARVISGRAREEWLLDRKARFFGKVSDSRGAAVPGVFVQAVQRRSGLAGNWPGQQSSSQQYVQGAETDAAGRYQIRLDPGIYDILFVPTGKPLARGELPSLAMSSEDQEHDHRLPEGLAVTGVVRDLTGRQFNGVTVEVYRTPGASATAAKLLGAGITDDLGRYRVVIPTTLDGASR
jgi:hypothetical protein